MNDQAPNGAMLDSELLASRDQQLAVMHSVQAAYSDDRDLLNQLLGQAQMADAFSQFSRTVRLTKLEHVKKSKLYRALAGKQMPNGSALSGTWEEFCELLGSSKDKVDLDLQNLRAFGAEAMESLSRMGIGYRELRQYRQLPQDSKDALIEAAKTGDKDSLLDLAEELIARQAQEKAQLTTKVEEAREDLARRDEAIAQNTQRINELRDEVARTRREYVRMSPDEQRIKLKQEITNALSTVEVHISEHNRDGGLHGALMQLHDHLVEHGGNETHWVTAQLDNLIRAVNSLKLAWPTAL